MVLRNTRISVWMATQFRFVPMRHYDLPNVWYWLWFVFGFWGFGIGGKK